MQLTAYRHSRKGGCRERALIHSPSPSQGEGWDGGECLTY